MKRIVILLLLVLFSISSTSLVCAKDNNEDNSLTTSGLPQAYSLVEEGRVTSVKNQAPFGTCWAHGFIASAESSAITKGYDDNSIDLSELHLAYYTYNNMGISDKLGLIANDYTKEYGSSGLDSGGIDEFATYITASGIGLVNEEDMPYGWGQAIQNGNMIPDTDLCFNTNSYLVSQVRWIDMTDKDYIKQLLVENGAISFAMGVKLYYDEASYNPNTAAYYNVDGSGVQPHTVTLVGWDDNYAVSNFLTAPEGPGAWLCKNSAGTLYGNQGYFWLSYYDKYIDKEGAQVEVIPSQDDIRIYQYDGTAQCARFITTKTDEYTMANLYTATRYEELTTLGFFTDEYGLDYTLKVYTDISDTSKPNSGTLKATIQGNQHDGGYHTVTLENPVNLIPGQTFSIVLTLKNPTGQTFRIFYDASDEYNFYNEVKPRESFAATSALSWSDMYSQGRTFRIKGYTSSNDTVSFENEKVTIEKGQTCLNDYTLGNPNNTLEFSSENPEIAQVDQDSGLITAIDYGTTTIVATVVETGATFSYEVFIPKHIETINSKVSEKYLHVDETYLIDVTFLPNDHDDSIACTYTGYDDSIISISSVGLVTALSCGETTITISSINNKTTTIRIIVMSDPESLETPEIIAARTSKTEITVEFNEVKEASYYQIQTSRDPDFNEVIETINTKDLSNVLKISFNEPSLYIRARACFKRDQEIISQWSSGKCIDILTVFNFYSENYLCQRINIIWTPKEYYDAYEIYCSDEREGEYTKIATVINGSKYSMYNAIPGTYYFKMRAYTEVNKVKYYTDFTYSSRVDFWLEEPKIKNITLVDYKNLYLSWNDTQANSYTLYRSEKKTSGYKELCTTISRNYQDSTISYGKTYYYKIVGNYSIKGTIYQSEANKIYTKTIILNPVEISLDTSGFEGIKINITDNNDIKPNTYKIYRSTSKKGTYSLIGTTSTYSYLDTNVSYGKTYYYKIKTIHDSYSSSYSEIKSIKYVLVTPVITDVSINEIGSMHIAWNEVVDADIYQLQYSTSKTKNYKTLVETTSLEYLHNNLKYGSTYYYRVIALKNINNKLCKSAYSSVKYKKMSLATPAIKDIESIGIINCNISWDAIPFASSYDIYYSTYSNKKFKLVASNLDATSYYVSNLSYGKTYYFKIIAKTNYLGKVYKSSYSKVKNMKCSLSKPSFTISKGDNALIININPVDNANGYVLYRSTSKNGSYKKVMESTNSTFTYSLSSKKTYYYKVKAYILINDKTYYSAYSSFKAGSIK